MLACGFISADTDPEHLLSEVGDFLLEFGFIAMEAETALGLREAVAERYERLRTLLDDRLGLEPAQETRLLHRRLLAQT